MKQTVQLKEDWKHRYNHVPNLKCPLEKNGHGFAQTPGDGEGQGSLACYGPWDCKELDTTE